MEPADRDISLFLCGRVSSWGGNRVWTVGKGRETLDLFEEGKQKELTES